MNFDPSKDYYKILGVPNNATSEQIKKARDKLRKDNHPDPLTGMRNKYEQTGDQDLLKILDEQIAQAEEKFKQIGEAYDVLSDPEIKKSYDSMRKAAPRRTTYAPPPPEPKPEIVFSKTTLNFGTMTKGDGASKTVTINNRGGMPDSIEISWDTQPAWAKPLLIVTDPDNTFPIVVTVEIKTGRIAPASYVADIIVTAGGEVFRLPVHLKIVEVVVPAPAPTPVSPRPRPTPAPAPVYTPPPVPPTKIPWGMIIVAVVIVGVIVAVAANINTGSDQSGQNNLSIQVVSYQTSPDTMRVQITNNDRVTHIVTVWGIMWFHGPPEFASDEYPAVDDMTNTWMKSQGISIGPNSTVTIQMIGTDRHYPYPWNVWSDKPRVELTQICAQVVVIDGQSVRGPTWMQHDGLPGCNPYFPSQN